MLLEHTPSPRTSCALAPAALRERRGLEEAMLLQQASQMSAFRAGDARRDRNVAVRLLDQPDQIRVLEVNDRLLLGVTVATRSRMRRCERHRCGAWERDR